MKAIDRPFTKLINGTTQFVIPVFQRDYSWSEDQCQQLWDDIVRVGADPSGRVHFMGSVVYIPSGDTAAGFTRWLLIDGQQRLTTVTLLLIALRNHLRQTNWTPASDDDPTPKRVDAYFLRNLQEDGDRQQKLVLRRDDQVVLRALLEDRTPPGIEGSRVLENYEFFRDGMAAADPKVVYAGIGRLIVVDVALDRVNDDPQMIFESLNSTGLDLSQADLIRNFILMRVAEKEQTRLYESHWRPIEELFRGAPSVFDSFARDYMTLRSQASKQTRGDQIYHAFRDFFRDAEAKHGLDSALAEMGTYARYYAAFALDRGAPANLAAPLRRLASLAEVAATVVMRLFDCHEQLRTLSEEQFREALELLESFVFRRVVCGRQTRGYNQVFSALAQRITDAAPLDTLKVALFDQSGNYAFPTDDEFRGELFRRDVYHMRTNHYLLDRLENHETKEPSDTSAYTVEHVMPQNEKLPRPWREMLGSGWKEVQAAWLHRLGNLTLTGYNGTYSDRSFDEKKTIRGGFKESAVRLNRFIREQKAWTATEMEDRGRMLSDLAVTVWPALEVSSDAVATSRLGALRAKAAARTSTQVPMTAESRSLFEILAPRIREVDGGIIEVAHGASVAYHAADGDFFVEVLPRKTKLMLLLNLEFGECTYRDDFVLDATEVKFFVRAEHEGGVYYRFKTAEQLDGALRLIREAHELAAR